MSRIYKFCQGVCDWKGTPEKAKIILGGKGAGLVMMANNQMPVPPGFTITTTVCNEFAASAFPEKYLNDLMDEAFDYDTWLGKQFGYMPLVSVRSGAPISMPGMMDTILNVGLTDDTIPEWSKRLGARAALDSYRRLIQMLGHTAYGVPSESFEDYLTAARDAAGVNEDWQLSVDDLHNLIDMYKVCFKHFTGHEFPQTRDEQMRAAVAAVFKSWMNPRAIEYRKINKIDAAMGTAVTVQAMVFGNTGENSGSGVLFTRNPSTGERVVMAEYLANAQGEDVVAGIRTPEALKIELTDGNNDDLADWRDDLGALCLKLEAVYRDMVDIEFTVQDGKLFLLQSRNGKRSARAAFKIAVDLQAEGVISKTEALERLTVEQFKVVRRPTIDPKFKEPAHKTGLPACPGVVSGKPVYSSEDAVNCTEPCILVTHETTPDDIAGMNASLGILTQTGGATSHAAVVARAMDKSCVVGCTDLSIADMKKANISRVTIDGTTGRVWFEIEVPVIDSSDAPEIKIVGQWCLAALDRVEAVPVYDDTMNIQTIMAATWWGSEEAADAIIADLIEQPSVKHVAIDLRSPVHFIGSDDLALMACFEPVLNHDEFLPLILKKLTDNESSLQGLTLINVPDHHHTKTGKFALIDTGCSGEIPAAVPADYAIFSILAK